MATRATRRKRATVYFDPGIHRALKIKAAETSRSISDIVDDALRRELSEDEEDLRAFEERAGEKTVSFEKVLKELKANGQI
jgi:plasmid stability protein